MNLKDLTFDGHWYTSFPSLNHWGPLDHKEYSERLRSFLNGGNSAHLYLHIPFCAKLCYYCICNIVVTNEREKIRFFLDHLLKEIDLLKGIYDEVGLNPDIRDLQFGGGTPSHLSQEEFGLLCSRLNSLSPLMGMDEVAMEIDPRTVKQEDLLFYYEHGVNRISFGIQDFDPQVQKAINREQPFEMVRDLLSGVRDKLSVNFDLLYGLPLQTHETIAKTIEQVVELSPDRITLLKYCHAPEVKKHMKLIKEEDLPIELAEMFVNIVDELQRKGYQWIGLDHFAKPADELTLAQINGTVHRTFNGFTPGRTKDMIGLGPTTTGAFGTTYAQAQYDLHEYYNSINREEFPVFRGYKLNYDETLRREVIFSLLCQQRVDFRHYGNYFNRELTLLEGSDLCTLKDGVLQVTKEGRYKLRNLCKIFDNKDVKPEHKKISQFPITRKVKLVA